MWCLRYCTCCEQCYVSVKYRCSLYQVLFSVNWYTVMYAYRILVQKWNVYTLTHLCVCFIIKAVAVNEETSNCSMTSYHAIGAQCFCVQFMRSDYECRQHFIECFTYCCYKSYIIFIPT